MPDQPGKGPPSSAPLSVEDADRIADSFTPFWEDDGDPAPAPAPAPAVAAPIVVPAARKAIGKQTLLGIAPPLIVRAPTPPFESADATQPMPALVTQPPPFIATPAVRAAAATAVDVTQPLPAVTAPPQPPPAPLPHNKTLLGFSTSAEAAHADPTATPEPALKSSPNVPGYAIAYTPKDGPSTPAVVIAPEAQSEPDNKRPMSLTVPSRLRAASFEAPVPVQQQSIVIDDDDFDPYAPKKGKGKLIGAVVGGLFAIVLGVLYIRAPSEGTAPVTGTATDPPAAAPAKDKPGAVQAATPTPGEPTPAAAAPTPRTTVAATTPPPKPAPAPIATAATRPPVAVRAQAPAAARPAAAARPKAEPVAATPTRPTARPPAATVPSETNSAPAKPASKGVIVRDAPF